MRLVDVGAIASSGGSQSYVKGYPFQGTSEPNVVAQFIFAQASGDLVDTVSTITLPVNGSPTFSVASAAAPFDLLAPGITFGTSGKFFYKDTPTASADIGTGSCTIEYWYKTTISSGAPIVWETDDEGGITHVHGMYHQVTGATGAMAWGISSSDGTSINRSWILPAEWNDGTLHKITSILNRGDDSVSMKFDEALISAQDAAGLAGKSIKNGIFSFGAYPFNGAAGFNGTIYSWRQSNNATNNSGPAGPF